MAADLPDHPATQQPRGQHFYQCGDERIVAHFEGDGVILSLPEQTVRLPRAIAAAGAKYSDEQLTLWIQDDTATVTGAERTTTHCRRHAISGPWEDARLRGIDFRAIGQEPGWMLEIDGGNRLYLETDYGQRRYVAPAPSPAADSDGRRIVYRVEANGQPLIVTIRGEPCQDIMSGEPFSHSVMLSLDGRTLEGCGQPLH